MLDYAIMLEAYLIPVEESDKTIYTFSESLSGTVTGVKKSTADLNTVANALNSNSDISNDDIDTYTDMIDDAKTTLTHVIQTVNLLHKYLLDPQTKEAAEKFITQIAKFISSGVFKTRYENIKNVRGSSNSSNSELQKKFNLQASRLIRACNALMKEIQKYKNN